MSGASVSISVTLRHCPQTGVTIPECSCRRCCRALVRRYAPPPLPEPRAEQLAGRLLARPIVTLEEYARRHGISPDTARKQAREREVQI